MPQTALTNHSTTPSPAKKPSQTGTSEKSPRRSLAVSIWRRFQVRRKGEISRRPRKVWLKISTAFQGRE